MPTKYEVRCEDGERRHDSLFSTHGDASHWAWWGHVCTARHEILPVELEPLFGLQVLALAFAMTIEWVYDEWHELLGSPITDWPVPPCALSRERFDNEMTRMCTDSFLRPRWFAEPKAFGNHWTI